jgi:hypothetical protein
LDVKRSQVAPQLKAITRTMHGSPLHRSGRDLAASAQREFLGLWVEVVEPDRTASLASAEAEDVQTFGDA